MWLERRFGARVEWLPYDLHPEYPPAGIPRAQLIERYGQGMTDRISALFADRDLPGYAPPPDIVPRSLTALRLGELARERGLHDAFHDRVMDAYWAESLDIGDADVLRRVSREAGLAGQDIDAVIGSDRYHDVVRASTEQALSAGITGVPGFVLDRRLLVLGAQPNEVFEQAFAQLGQ